MTDKPAIGAAPSGQDDNTARIAQILVATFDSDNHDTLDADITRLMLDLSADVDLDATSGPQGDDRLRTVVRAVLMALRGRGPVNG